MSGGELIMLCAYILALLGIVVPAVMVTRPWPKRRANPEPEAAPTLTEVYAFAMGHWDKQFYAVLDAALPGTCECNPYPFSCPIHQSPPEKLRDLTSIQKQVERKRESRERRLT